MLPVKFVCAYILILLCVFPHLEMRTGLTFLILCHLMCFIFTEGTGDTDPNMRFLFIMLRVYLLNDCSTR